MYDSWSFFVEGIEQFSGFIKSRKERCSEYEGMG